MISLRAFAESPEFCNLDPSPLVAAIYDAACGIRPTSIDDDASRRHFGCTLDELPLKVARVIAVRAGRGAGKSTRLGAVVALWLAWSVELPNLRRNEAGYFVIVAPDIRLARQVLSFVVGYIEDSDILRRAMVGDATTESVTLKRPDGALVRIECLPATRGGRAVRNRTIVGALLDEAAFFLDESTGVVNDAAIFEALIPRMVEGAQLWEVSTPWIEGVGLLEQTMAKNFGVHDRALCVQAPTRALNPNWDPTGELERDLREHDPDVATREIDAIALGGGAGLFFDPIAVTQSIDHDAPLEAPWRQDATVYGVGADFAFKRDSAALAIVARTGSGYTLARIEERRPKRGAPLKPSETVAEFAAVARGYRVKSAATDGHYVESVREHLRAAELQTMEVPGGSEGKSSMYVALRTLLNEGRFQMPHHPRLERQLREVIARPTAGGAMSISSPRTSAGHGDLVSAVVAAVWMAQFGVCEPYASAVAFGGPRSDPTLGPTSGKRAGTGNEELQVRYASGRVFTMRERAGTTRY